MKINELTNGWMVKKAISTVIKISLLQSFAKERILKEHRNKLANILLKRWMHKVPYREARPRTNL